MGRDSTGAITHREALRIELSYLIKKGMIKKGCEISGILNWTNGSWIRIETNYKTNKENYIRLIYTQTDKEGNKTNQDYKIYLASVPSNLGKGEVLYFICPETHRYCRVLYSCYGSPIWKSRFAYRHRIYYMGQNSSKCDYSNDKYHSLKNQIESLKASKRKQLLYKGKPTKFALRLKRLEYARDNYGETVNDIFMYKICKTTFPKHEFKRLLKRAQNRS